MLSTLAQPMAAFMCAPSTALGNSVGPPPFETVSRIGGLLGSPIQLGCKFFDETSKFVNRTGEFNGVLEVHPADPAVRAFVDDSLFAGLAASSTSSAWHLVIVAFRKYGVVSLAGEIQGNYQVISRVDTKALPFPYALPAVGELILFSELRKMSAFPLNCLGGPMSVSTLVNVMGVDRSCAIREERAFELALGLAISVPGARVIVPTLPHIGIPSPRVQQQGHLGSWGKFAPGMMIQQGELISQAHMPTLPQGGIPSAIVQGQFAPGMMVQQGELSSRAIIPALPQVGIPSAMVQGQLARIGIPSAMVQGQLAPGMMVQQGELSSRAIIPALPQVGIPSAMVQSELGSGMVVQQGVVTSQGSAMVQGQLASGMVALQRDELPSVVSTGETQAVDTQKNSGRRDKASDSRRRVRVSVGAANAFLKAAAAENTKQADVHAKAKMRECVEHGLKIMDASRGWITMDESSAMKIVDASLWSKMMDASLGGNIMDVSSLKKVMGASRWKKIVKASPWKSILDASYPARAHAKAPEMKDSDETESEPLEADMEPLVLGGAESEECEDVTIPSPVCSTISLRSTASPRSTTSLGCLEESFLEKLLSEVGLKSLRSFLPGGGWAVSSTCTSSPESEATSSPESEATSSPLSESTSSPLLESTSSPLAKVKTGDWREGTSWASQWETAA